LGLSIPALSLVASVLIGAWIAMVVVVKREYLHSFRQGLEKKAIEPEAMQLRRLDAAAMQTLLSQLESDDERHVLYALDLLRNTHPNRWRDHIDVLIQHPSSAVRGRTLAVLASWNDPTIAREEFIHHPDYQTARIATATALRFKWSDSGRDRALLNRLLHDWSEEVIREAIVTAGVVRHTEAVPFLIEKLADRSLRRDARHALLKFGDAVISQLVGRLSSDGENPAIRRRIPKALALTGKQTAADALIRRLHRLDFHLDYAVLKALNRLRMTSPDTVINPELVNVAINKEREEYNRLRSVEVWLKANPFNNPVYSLLVRAIHERLQHRVERIFRLIGLIYPPQDIYSVYYNCLLKPALRPAAIEFLDNLLDVGLKETVIPLLEEAFDPENATRVRAPIQFISVGAALSMLVSGDDPWLKTIAGELQKQIGERSDESRERRVIPH